MSKSGLLKIRNDRRAKIEKLREMGANPFPATSNRDHMVEHILTDPDALMGQAVTVAGRLVAKRRQGKLSFLRILDGSGEIQLFLRKDEMAQTAGDVLGYDAVPLLDVGDYIECQGTVMRTERGELSVLADHVRMLTKSLRPLPDQHAGLSDRETILRQRYLHTNVEPAAKTSFEKVGEMLRVARKFLTEEKGFVEILTPVLQPLYGGGTARPFTTHLNALDLDMYLSISHELYLKRMIAGQFERVFTIGRYFRNEGIDATHNPEFSMIETMAAYENYEDGMQLIEELFQTIARDAFGKTVFKVGGHDVDMAGTWRRASIVDLVKEKIGKDFSACPDLATAHAWLDEHGVEEKPETIGQCLYQAYDDLVVDHLVGPVLAYGHPVEVSPLAKPMADDPRYAERFEIIIGGMECGDNWSEANDPEYLLTLWKESAQRRMADGDPPHPLDYDFIEMLEHGMPPTTGIGPGIERMAMIFCEVDRIDDVNFFPIMKPVVSDLNRKAFDIPKNPPHVGLREVGLTWGQLEAALADAPSGLTVQPVMRNWGDTVIGHLVVESADERWVVSGYSVERTGSSKERATAFTDAVAALFGATDATVKALSFG